MHDPELEVPCNALIIFQFSIMVKGSPYTLHRSGVHRTCTGVMPMGPSPSVFCQNIFCSSIMSSFVSEVVSGLYTPLDAPRYCPFFAVVSMVRSSQHPRTAGNARRVQTSIRSASVSHLSISEFKIIVQLLILLS